MQPKSFVKQRTEGSRPVIPSAASADTENKNLGGSTTLRGLLSYYRNKMEALTMDNEAFQRRLEQIADVVGDQHTLQGKLRESEKLVGELKQNLSEMQVCLYQERDHVLRLYAENDRLKLRELDDRRKIQHLLQLSGLGPAEVTYFLSETTLPSLNPSTTAEKTRDQAQPSALIINPVVPAEGTVEYIANGSVRKTGGHVRDRGDATEPNSSHKSDAERSVPRLEHLAIQRELEFARGAIKALQRQLEEQTKNSRDEIESLIENQQSLILESQAQLAKFKEKEITMENRLKRCQEMLCSSTKDFLQQRQKFRQAEKEWILERDLLVRKQAGIPCAKARRSEVQSAGDYRKLGSGKPAREWTAVDHLSGPDQVDGCDCEHQKLITNLEFQLSQQQNLADMYREQVLQMEDKLIQLREENQVSKEAYQEHTERLHSQLRLSRQRYRDLERRRHLEVEGYQTDLDSLRKKLKDVEKKFLQMTLCRAKDPDPRAKSLDNVDLRILENVRQTSSRSKFLLNDLKSLKVLMYNLEDEMRKL
ncbi:hypothetical protein AAHC03_0790 [Spirometra sp. Aus1]